MPSPRAPAGRPRGTDGHTRATATHRRASPGISGTRPGAAARAVAHPSSGVQRASAAAGGTCRRGRSLAAAACPSGAGARYSKPPLWASPWASPRAASSYNSSCTAYIWRSSVLCQVLDIDCRQRTGQNKATSSAQAGGHRLAYVRMRPFGGGGFFSQLRASMFSPSPCCLADLWAPPLAGASSSWLSSSTHRGTRYHTDTLPGSRLLVC